MSAILISDRPATNPIKLGMQSRKSGWHFCPTCKKSNEIGHAVEEVEQVGSRARIAKSHAVQTATTHARALTAIRTKSRISPDPEFTPSSSTSSTIGPIDGAFFQVGQTYQPDFLDYNQGIQG